MLEAAEKLQVPVILSHAELHEADVEKAMRIFAGM